MSIDFNKVHSSMLLKYSGISFISGAVNHGFFSGERSLWTAALGVLLFILGALFEFANNKTSEDNKEKSWLSVFLWGTFLSIGLGFFTGGLQHFPDSPERSLWVVPLGFFISVVALFLNESCKPNKSHVIYIALTSVLVVAGSFAGAQLLKGSGYSHQHSEGGHSHGAVTQPESSAAHAHNEHDAMPHDHHAMEMPSNITRTIEVTTNDEMRFIPSTIKVNETEVIRFVVHNKGNVTHEMVIGTENDIKEHALQMQSGNANHAMSHGTSHSMGMVSVPAQETREFVFDFKGKSDLYVACLVAGHYEAGMKGSLIIEKAPVNHQH